MTIRKLRAGRVPNANAATWVGEVGTLFYNETNGVFRLSDGITPGGRSIPYTIATSSIIGGIKAGPGANVSVDGTLTIDTADLPLSFGHFTAVDNTLSTVNVDEDMNLVTNGNATINLVGNVFFYTASQWNGNQVAYFEALDEGQITVRVPVDDPNNGALKIIGSASGNVQSPINTGVMFHVTGHNSTPSRLYNDAIGGYSGFIARRYNGLAVSPTQVLNGDEIARFGINAYQTGGWLNIGQARISFMSTDNQDSGNQGTKIDFYSTPKGATTSNITKVLTIDATYGANVTGNLYVYGNTITSGNCTAGNVQIATSGTLTTPRIIINDGGIRNLGAVNTANISFATDSIVTITNPTDTVTINLSNYVAGAIVRVIVHMTTAHTINLGVSAAVNSTVGATSLAGNKLVNNQSVILNYICAAGDAATTYVQVSYV